MAIAVDTLPPGRAPRQSVSGDDLVKRGLMALICL